LAGNEMRQQLRSSARCGSKASSAYSHPEFEANNTALYGFYFWHFGHKASTLRLVSFFALRGPAPKAGRARIAITFLDLRAPTPDILRKEKNGNRHMTDQSSETAGLPFFFAITL